MMITKQEAAAIIDEEMQGGRISEDDAASLLALVETKPESHLELLRPTATPAFVIKFLRSLEGGRLLGTSAPACILSPLP